MKTPTLPRPGVGAEVVTDKEVVEAIGYMGKRSELWLEIPPTRKRLSPETLERIRRTKELTINKKK